MLILIEQTIRIATRKSQLAQWQARYVASALRRSSEKTRTQLVPLVTQGDRVAREALSEAGGKRLFVRELEAALLDETADIAVHSLKDMPAELPPGLTIAAVVARACAADALVSNRFERVADLPDGALIGTSSLRRACQLLHCRPTLRVKPLRGNVDTRLAKLDAGDYDAIVLACAGLERLGYKGRISEVIPFDVMLPAIGQGAIAIECREDSPMCAWVHNELNDAESACCTTAERVLSLRLGADCRLPIAAYAVRDGREVYLRALVGDPSGKRLLRAEGRSAAQDPQQAGVVTADALLAQGAAELLAKVGTARR